MNKTAMIQRHFVFSASACVLLFIGACGMTPSNQRTMETSPPWGICTGIDNAEPMKAAGYSYVEESVRRFLIPLEPDNAFEKKLAQAVKSPLKIYSYNGFIPDDLKSTGPETHHDKILEYAKTAFERARQVGSKIIVFGSGGSRRLPEGFPYDGATEQFTQLLKRMGPIAAQYGITVVIEPLNSQECNFINSVKEATDIARTVDHPNIAVLADIYHMAKDGEGPDSIRNAGKLLKHCHLAELEGRRMPGVNNYDFTPYFKAMKDIQYQGRLSLEGKWDNFNEQLPAVVAYLNDQWANAE